MAFEVFDKRLTPLTKAPTVTIQKRGLLSLNQAAHALIGSPKTVELLYDKDEKIVGIRPASDDTPHGYTIRPQGGAAKGAGAPVIIAGTAFTAYYGIDTTTSMRWTPTVRDNILCIDLKEPGVPVIGNRRAKEAREQDKDA